MILSVMPGLSMFRTKVLVFDRQSRYIRSVAGDIEVPENKKVSAVLLVRNTAIIPAVVTIICLDS
jgi:hypothetical protein